jgi:LacI family transcriptional regulator
MQLEIVQGDFEEQSGQAAVRALLGEGRAFDAVFAANDMMALGALRALQTGGRKVPDEVAVAGFDDIPLARLLGLTTVRVRIADLGQRSLTRLIGMLEGASGGGDELHEPELVVRGTTDAEARATA